MSFNTNDAQKLLEARIDDGLRQSDRGELVCGNFLTPAEMAHAKIVISAKRAADRVFFYGGFDGAERKRIFFIPSYLSDFEGDAEEKAREYCADEFSAAIRSIKIKGSGYRVLGHRDYLGSILSLGIERREIGDIIVEDEHGAIIFCSDRIFDYLITGIDRIATDKVKVEPYVPGEDFKFERKTAPISDTVASKRFDCIVGALTNLAREKAQNLINSGMCEVDHLPEERVDRQIDEGMVISVRGYGKYFIKAFDGETKRGRIRLLAEKYI